MAPLPRYPAPAMGQDENAIRDLGERRFAWLLAQRGYRYLTEKCLDEADLLWPALAATGKRPDFYAWNEATGVRFLADVKSLVVPFDAVEGGELDYAQALKRFAAPLRSARKQLEPFAGLGLPLLVVFDNHSGVQLPTAPLDLIQLFAPLDLGGGGVFGLRGGRRSVPPFLSALAANLHQSGHVADGPPGHERPMRLRVVHNPEADVSLPVTAFNDPADEHYSERDDEWINLKTGAGAFE